MSQLTHKPDDVETFPITISLDKGEKIKFDAYNEVIGLDHPLFLHFEKLWWQWYEETVQHNSEIEAMYFSDEACYSKKGAIYGGIEIFIEVMQEKNQHHATEKDIAYCDYECAFN